MFVDFDGTLVEIAQSPEAVRAPAHLSGLLKQVQERYGGAFALISGRSIAALDDLLQPWRGAAAGLHGGERRRPDGSRADVDPIELTPVLADACGAVAAFVAANPPVRLEDKGRTLALHYRAAPELRQEVTRFAEQVAAESSGALRLVCGKMVAELVPRDFGKGRAIAAFLAEPPFRGRVPVFLGDDLTDEEGFAEIRRRKGVAIRVGSPDAETLATYTLPDVAAVLAWLSNDGAAEP
ncbi:MAG TPA: trehalose-phosphatase [Stellaceae bacterium]|nr:trehalose-phosphatase [Stellaceae bacterium]